MVQTRRKRLGQPALSVLPTPAAKKSRGTASAGSLLATSKSPPLSQINVNGRSSSSSSKSAVVTVAKKARGMAREDKENNPNARGVSAARSSATIDLSSLPDPLKKKSKRHDPSTWLTWEERITQLNAFRDVFGHLDVSTSRKDPHVELGQWLAAQVRL